MALSLIEQLDQAAELELTSVENQALYRLSDNKDFKVFSDVMARKLVKSGYDLIREKPIQGQDVDQIMAQGAFKFFRDMLKMLDGAKVAPTKVIPKE